MRILAFFLEGFKGHPFGKKPTATKPIAAKPLRWRAYTKSGKIVLIEGYRVVRVLNPSKQPRVESDPKR